MAKLSELRPGQKVVFSPINDKAKKMTGEIAEYVFLAVIQTAEGKQYAHSDDIDVLEQPKPSLSDEMKRAIAEQVKAIQSGAAAPAPPVIEAPVWDEIPAESGSEAKPTAETSSEEKTS